MSTKLRGKNLFVLVSSRKLFIWIFIALFISLIISSFSLIRGFSIFLVVENITFFVIFTSMLSIYSWRYSLLRPDLKLKQEKTDNLHIISLEVLLLYMQIYLFLFIFTMFISFFIKNGVVSLLNIVNIFLSLFFLYYYSKEDIYVEELLKSYERDIIKKRENINLGNILDLFLFLVRTILTAGFIFALLKILQNYTTIEKKGITLVNIPDIAIVLTLAIYFLQSIIHFLFRNDLKKFDEQKEQLKMVKGLINYLFTTSKKKNPPHPKNAIIEFLAKKQVESPHLFVKKWYSIVYTNIMEDVSKILDFFKKETNSITYKFLEFLFLNLDKTESEWKLFIERLNKEINQTFLNMEKINLLVEGIEKTTKMMTIILSAVLLNLLIAVAYFFAIQFVMSMKGVNISSLGSFLSHIQNVNPKKIEIFGTLETLGLLLVATAPSVLYLPFTRNPKFYVVKTVKLFFILYIISVISLGLIKYGLAKIG